MNVLEEKIDDIKIFPSVTEDYVNISIQNYYGKIQTKIYALSGDFIDLQNGNKLSFKKMNSGVYFCQITYADKNKILKIVKL